MANQVLIDFLKEREGTVIENGKHVAYLDEKASSKNPHYDHDAGGLWTVGYGHTGPEVKQGYSLSDEEAEQALQQDLKWVDAEYDRVVKADLNENQQAAVKSLIYNVGGPNFAKSKALKALNKGDMETFRKEAFDPDKGFTKATVGGKKQKDKGLVNRRGFEDKLFTTGMTEAKQEVPEGWIQGAPDEAPYDPNDRHEMKQGFRHEFDLVANPAPLAKPEDVEGLMASNVEGGPVMNTDAAPEPVAAPAPDVTELATPEVREPGRAQDIREKLGLSMTPAPLQVEAVPQRQGAGNDQINSAAVAQEQAEKPTLWEITKASAQVDNTIPQLLRKETEFPIDLDFSGKDYWKQNKERLDAMPGVDLEEIMEDVVTASSSEAAEYWLSKHEKDYANEQLLLAGGAKSFLPRMALSILDPVDIGVSVVTGGTAGAVLKAGKWGKIATAALTAGAATGATEAMLASQNASRDSTDVMFATLAGLGLGGGIGGLVARHEAKKVNKILDELAEDNMDGAARALNGDDSAGAQRRASESEGPNKRLAGKAYEDAQEALADMDAPEFRFEGLQKLFHTMQSKFLYSESEMVRKVGAAMFEGGYLKNKGVRGRTAEGTANLLHRTFRAGIFRDSMPMFKAWAKENGVGSIKRNIGAEAGADFYGQVGRALRGEVADDISSHATQAAAAMRKHIDQMYDLAAEAGVKGFDRGGLEDYFPRLINRSSFDEVVRKYEHKGLADWFSRSIQNANIEIAPELADRIADGYVYTMRRKIAGIETDLLHGIRLDDVEKLKEVFEGWRGLDDLLEEIENMKLSENAKRGTVSFGKKRIQFDESFEAPIINKKTGERESLKFHQLYENDARKVLHRYSHAMSGHIGMAKEMGIKSRDEWETFEKGIIDEAEISGRSIDDAKKEVTALREGYDLLVGRNSIDPNPTGDISKLSRTWTGYTYATRGGQFGVNALAEIGNVIGAVGVRAFMRSMPEWKSMVTRAANGELDHDLARTSELLFAPGIQGMTGVAIKNMDEFGERLDGSGLVSRVAQAADGPIKVAGRATSMASGLNALTDIPQRIAGVEMLRKLARFANGGKISKGQAARLRGMGLSNEMQQRIFKMMREDGAGVYKNGRLVDLDVEKWTDTDALDALTFGINREVRSIIQENDISTVTKYFHHPVGRVMMQFLRFPMEAVNKQLARSIHYADAEAIKSFTSSLFITSTAYIAQTSIDYANNPEELKKRLTPENIAKVAFMRTGVSSMIPTAVDMAMPLVGGKVLGEDSDWVNKDGKLFSYGRSTGLTTGLMGSPVTDTIDRAYRAGSNIVTSALSPNQQVTQQDVKDIFTLVPGYRTLGFKNAIQAVAETFPESRKED